MNNHTDKTEKKALTGRRILILLAAVITALAVAVTCALCIDTSSGRGNLDAGQGDALTSASATYSSSGTYNFTNTAGVIANNRAGRLNNGDVLTFAYCGNAYTVVLPRGTYTFSVWGAQGGSYSNTSNGGQGGYSTGTFEVTSASQTFYIYVGGQGSWSRGSRVNGGYNGGGYATASTTQYGTGSGGGATHIATRSGLLSSLNSYRSDVKIVAGGGGGGDYGNGGRLVGGAGGGATGGNGPTSGYRIATGGTQTGGGSNGNINNSQHRNITTATFGQGASGDGSGNTWYGGGGGGGWFGGGYGGTHAGGGGGSGYIGGVTGGRTTNGGRTGNGQAQIVAVNVNKGPESKNYSQTITSRGMAISLTVRATDLAADNDYANSPNAAIDRVYFTNGDASSYDNFTATNNTRLYVDAACTKQATEYFDWTWSGNNAFTITNVKKYPRSGVDGCTANGTIRLYAKLRDNFGDSGVQRGVEVIPFTITVSANSIRQRGTNNPTTAVVKDSNANPTGGTNRVFFGISAADAHAPTGTVTPGSSIYNPLGGGRYTAIFEQPIKYQEMVTLNVTDLVLGDLDGNAIFGGDAMVAVLSSTTAITGASRKFALNEYDNNRGVVAYNASRTRLANAFETLTFQCLIPDPAFQVFTVTVYQVEKVPAAGLGLTYVEPNTSPNAGGRTAVTIDIVFKMDNTRPVLRTTTNRAPVLSVNTLEQTTIKLNDYFMDVDATDQNYSITASTHEIVDVIVPQNEYIQLDKYGGIVSTQISGTSYFNVIADVPDIQNATRFGNALATGQLGGSAEYATGYRNWYISNGSDNLINTAYIRYAFRNDELTVTGLRATYADMTSGSRTSKQSATGGNITDGPEMSGGVGNAGHFYILIHVLDKNDLADEGIWLPLGIQVNNAQPQDMSQERDGAGAGALPTASGDPGSSFYFTPMGITVGQNTSPIGVYSIDGGNTFTNSNLIPIATDADNFYASNMLNGLSLQAQGEAHGVLNELVTLVSDDSAVQNSVANNDDGYYFTVQEIDVYVPTAYFGDRVKLANYVTDAATQIKEIAYPTGNGGTVNADCLIIKGLKITLNQWTHNRYLHARVEVRDSNNTTNTVHIAVNVTNKAPEYLVNDNTQTNIATINYSTDGATYNSAWRTETDQNNKITIAEITYSVPVHSTVIITPYDLLGDVNMPKYADGLTGGFTLNGLSGWFDGTSGTYYVDQKKPADDNVQTHVTLNGVARDYNTETYKAALFGTIGGLQATRTFGRFTADNLFGNVVDADSASIAARTTNVDRLYFARTGDATDMDGFTFDPYGANASINDFSDPDIIGGNGILSATFGNKLLYNNNTYNLDYLVITTENRTQTTASIELTVRDRTGASAQGGSYGIKRIRVNINVVNSSPRVQYKDKFYTLTTNPTGGSSLDVSDASAAQTIVPSTIVLNAVSDRTDTSKNLLIDAEDGSNIWFDLTHPIAVVDKNDETGSPRDAFGNDYLGNYLNVSIAQNTLTITALNSTQAIPTLYVRFSATDGRYDSRGNLEFSTCYIRVQVVNSTAKINTGDNGFEAVKSDPDNENSHDLYYWNIESGSNSDKTRSRYFVSSANAESALRAEAVSAGQMKRITTDTDKLQGIVLSAGTAPGFPNNAYVNAYTAAEDKVTAYKNAVPRLNQAVTWSSSPTSSNPSPVAIAGTITVWNGQSNNDASYVYDNTIIGGYDILYFIPTANGYEKYLASELFGNKYDEEWKGEGFISKFFDKEGRWIVSDWAVMVTPSNSTPAGRYINLGLSLRDETKLGGDTAGKNTAYNANSNTPVAINDNVLFTYNLYVSDMGIVPYTYYDQFDGYYTVEDGKTNPTVLVPTYDNLPASSYYNTIEDNPGYQLIDAENYPTLYYNNNIITNNSDGAKLLKTRPSAGGYDNTRAGVHSGVPYVYDNADYKAGYTYDLYTGAGEKRVDTKESAFRYSKTISVSGDSSKTTYVPMSYFALRQALIDDNNASFDLNRFVSFDTGEETATNRSLAFLMNNAVSISDGINTWSGGEGAINPLASNPYVSISVYDEESADESKAGEKLRAEIRESSYFNNAISVGTYDGEKTKGFVEYSVNDSNPISLIKDNVVGKNGELLYLENQDNIYRGLQEHLFGLEIKKKSTRSSSDSLTITVKVASCFRNENGSVQVDKSASSGSENANANQKNSATVTFKLDIGNSPIDLMVSENENNVVAANRGAAIDSVQGAGYYYTNLLDLTANGASKTIKLSSRSTANIAGADRVIGYEDEDYVEGNPAASDQAKFSLDSLRQVNNWTTGFNRTREFDGSGGSRTLRNTKATDAARNSMYNYFGKSIASDIESLPTSNDQENHITAFRPNGGMYADSTREGYGRYFGVSISADGTALTITPLAKTVINDEVINAEMNADKTKTVNKVYEDRGLVRYQIGSNKYGGYYPLKVLIYDDHGDGFGAASYVALEIRVSISSTSATLSDNLDEYKTDDGVDGKMMTVPMAVNQTYPFNLSQVLVGGNLLKNTSATSSTIFWKNDYDALLNKSDKTTDEQFMLDSGSYLLSPFYNYTIAYGEITNRTPRVQNYSVSGSANDIATDNETLRNGNAGFSSNPTLDSISVTNLPDVVMYMMYDTADGQILTADKRPTGNTIIFAVNRRTVFTEAGASKPVDKFEFVLNFTDSDNNTTENLHIVINITNQTPYVRSQATQAASGLRMRVGDSFTVLTTPYNRFLGSTVDDAPGVEHRASASAAASTSYNYVVNRVAHQFAGIVEPKLLAAPNPGSGVVTYEDMREHALVNDDRIALHSYTDNGGSRQELGYLAVADDDTPWGLRITGVRYGYPGYFTTSEGNDCIPKEGVATGIGDPSSKLSVQITAVTVCRNMPITIEITDANNAVTTFTMYVTVESSKPYALDDHDTQNLSDALIPVYETVNGQKVLQPGEYNMLMVSDNIATQTVYMENVLMANYTDVTLSGLSNDNADIFGTPSANGAVRAYGKVRLPISEIAKDPDAADDQNISIYSDSRSGNAYNIISFNGEAMQRRGNVYYNDMFNITVADDYKTLEIECLTYNPYRDTDVIGFYIRDCGNDVFENAIPITINITTLYSSITNAGQMTTANIRNGAFTAASAIRTVNVKPVDYYTGISELLPEDKEERDKIVDVESLFPFLDYVDMKDAIDQSEQDDVKPFVLSDPDVVANDYNKNYELRVYALMTPQQGSDSDYEGLSLTALSSLFEISSESGALSRRVLKLKSEENVAAQGYSLDDFIIGGFYEGGATITDVNRSLVMFLERYFVFGIGDDGVSLTFRPVSRNYDITIPLYVEITKYVDSNARHIAMSNVDITCGNVFYVDVLDSAPIANSDAEVLKFAGVAGSSAVFKLHDNDDPFGSMFTDSDMNDVVTYDGYISATNLQPDYIRALQKATDLEIDWQAVDSTRKSRAIDIRVNDAAVQSTVVVNGQEIQMPAHSVLITINRRIDMLDENGNYMDEVVLPVTIFARDRSGLASALDIEVTVQNSGLDIDRSMLTPVTPDTRNGYYRLSAVEDSPREYTLDAYIVPGRELAPFYFVSSNTNYISDPDFTRMTTDTDSFRLVGESSESSDSYLQYDKALTVHSDTANIDVASVTAVHGYSGVDIPADKFHFTGVRIQALTDNRTITDASAKMRIIDRSGDAANIANGVTVTIVIHILNAPPTVKSDIQTDFVIVGSVTSDGAPVVINVDDYAEDRNGDSLKINGIWPIYGDDGAGGIHCVNADDNQGDIVSFTIDEKTQKSVTFVPKRGFFGSQSITVVVADVLDGDAGDFGTAEFTINFTVTYDVSTLELNSQTAIRSLPKTVTSEMLFADIGDMYVSGSDGVADASAVFNPGSYYVIDNLVASGSVRTLRNGDEWQFVGDRVADSVEFEVTFKSKVNADSENAITMTKRFTASIVQNTAPTLNQRFRDDIDGFVFSTGSGNSAYGLDNNGTATLTTDVMFEDIDIPSGDSLLFDPKAISVSSPTMCNVRVSDDGTMLYLTFNCRGTCNLTVGVMDKTGETTRFTFKIRNLDRPDPSFMDKVSISYEEHSIIWWAVIIGILVLIALLILIILLLKRRKRKREELEAILISEMELEEQMMRLSASSTGAAAPYQSYGFLPPTMPVQNDPNLMLGSSAPGTQPGAAQPLGLNSGSGTAGDSGVPTDSDM